MRILILSASVGAGHVRAAEAVEAALKPSGAEVVNYDVLKLMTPAFRKLYSDGYFEMVKRAPRLLGWLYDATDKPFHKDQVRAKLEQAGAVRLLKKIRTFDADIAICTHFLPTVLLDRERRHNRSHARIITVVTDFEVHGMWLAAPSDHYFVATAEAREHLIGLGIESAAVTVSGIPTHPIFAEAKDRAQLRHKHGWRAGLPALLISAGGFGAGHAERMVEALIDAGLSAQIIAVCGKSAALKAAIEKIARRNQAELPVVIATGFTTEMDEFMAAADLMIGKPGGLTTSESLIKGLGWVVVNPIPGQEEKNAIYLLEQGVGVWADNLHTLGYKVKSVLEQPGRLADMRRNALRIARPDAGAIIAKYATAL
ncbi:MAG TPA: glycosyltransferase [Candidatus Solibacter sp.]|nr:glycosyltransferase [Candidatus Solibacter sp.]